MQVAHAGTLGTAQVCSQGGDLQRAEEQQVDSGACPAHSSLLVPCLDVHPLCSGLLEGETLTVLTFPGSHFWDLPAHGIQSLFLHSPSSPSPAVLPMFLLTNSLLLCFPEALHPFCFPLLELFSLPGSLVTLPCHPPSSLPLGFAVQVISHRGMFSPAQQLLPKTQFPLT